MKRTTSIALAFALVAATAQAEIIQIITEDGEMRYIDTNAGTMVDNAAPGTVSGPRESHLADSTIGFATRPQVAPNPTPSNPSTSRGGGGCSNGISAGSQGWCLTDGQVRDDQRTPRGG